MIFSKQFLRDALYEKSAIHEEIVDVTRWSIVRQRVFEHDGKLYKTTYSQGATEIQDESPYEYDPDEIECPEVVPVERIVTVYEEADKSCPRKVYVRI